MIRLLTILLLATITSFHNKADKPAICGTYTNKRTNDLFQVRVTMRLNCDSTFGYIRTSCLGVDTSFGYWKYFGDKIQLRSSQKLLNIIQKQKDTNRITFVDLNNANLTYTTLGLEISNARNFNDTLYKKEH